MVAKRIIGFILRWAKKMLGGWLSFYRSRYIRYFRKQIKNALDLAWWSISCSSAITVLLIGMFLAIKMMTLAQAEAFGTMVLPWVFFFFGGIAIVGIFFAFLDTVTRYILKREPMIDTDTNTKIATMEKDIKDIKTAIEEIKAKLTSS